MLVDFKLFWCIFSVEKQIRLKIALTAINNNIASNEPIHSKYYVIYLVLIKQPWRVLALRA